MFNGDNLNYRFYMNEIYAPSDPSNGSLKIRNNPTTNAEDASIDISNDGNIIIDACNVHLDSKLFIESLSPKSIMMTNLSGEVINSFINISGASDDVLIIDSSYTKTLIKSSSVEIGSNTIKLASNAATLDDASGSGIEVSGNKTFLYNSLNDSWISNIDIRAETTSIYAAGFVGDLTGNVTGDLVGDVSANTISVSQDITANNMTINNSLSTTQLTTTDMVVQTIELSGNAPKISAPADLEFSANNINFVTPSTGQIVFPNNTTVLIPKLQVTNQTSVTTNVVEISNHTLSLGGGANLTQSNGAGLSISGGDVSGGVEFIYQTGGGGRGKWSSNIVIDANGFIGNLTGSVTGNTTGTHFGNVDNANSVDANFLTANTKALLKDISTNGILFEDSTNSSYQTVVYNSNFTHSSLGQSSDLVIDPGLGGRINILGDITASQFEVVKKTVVDIGQTVINLCPSATTATDANGGGFSINLGKDQQGNQQRANFIYSSTNDAFDSNIDIKATAFIGPLTGDVTGDVTGNVTGDLVGNASGNSATFVNLTGTLKTLSQPIRDIIRDDALNLPVGTTSDRPQATDAKIGDIRFNTTINSFEGYIADPNAQYLGIWGPIGGSSGGSLVDDDGDTFIDVCDNNIIKIVSASNEQIIVRPDRVQILGPVLEFGSYDNSVNNATFVIDNSDLIIDPAPSGGDNDGNLIIRGNLIVKGTETTVNSTNVNLENNSLTLNSSAVHPNASIDISYTDPAGNTSATYTSLKFDSVSREWSTILDSTMNLGGFTSFKTGKLTATDGIEVSGNLIPANNQSKIPVSKNTFKIKKQSSLGSSIMARPSTIPGHAPHSRGGDWVKAPGYDISKTLISQDSWVKLEFKLNFICSREANQLITFAVTRDGLVPAGDEDNVVFMDKNMGSNMGNTNRGVYNGSWIDDNPLSPNKSKTNNPEYHLWYKVGESGDEIKVESGILGDTIAAGGTDSYYNFIYAQELYG